MRLRWLIIGKRTQLITYLSNPSEADYSRCRTIPPKIHKLINSILNKEEFPADWKELIIVSIYKKGDKT